jgi:Asp-tRNA(Asn)/Glu-tRNA(Gln) amidotransferase A subunit family amidase
MKAPRTAGWLLRLLVWLIERPVLGPALTHKLLADAGLFRVRHTDCEDGLPGGPPLPRFDGSGGEDRPPIILEDIAGPSRFGEGYSPATAHDYAQAYGVGTITPSAVAEAVIAAQALLDSQTPSMAIFIATDAEDLRAQARASTERWAAGAPLSPLDGVPVAVKDEMAQKGYPTTLGTSFLGVAAETEDATIVARMRAAGALLVGKANMHEIGIGVTGINPHHGATRNPYDPSCSPGGSSSGSAAAVSSGLVPIALGADGGGSIRIPASLCGVVGLKATWGRLSEHGVPPLCWSVAHVGPLATSVTDCALAYGVMAGPDPRDPGTQIQPAAHLDGLGASDLSGLRIGLYRPWFEDADPAVVQACHEGLDALVEAGATLVDVEVSELSLLKTAHVITILGEMAASQHAYDKKRRARYGTETRLNLALASALGAHDYVAAQRHRTRICAHFDGLYESIDVLATPTCGRTAPPVPSDALATGLSNIPVTDQIMRFAPAANLTGLPAISLPVGYDGDGLPIGMQLMGRAWEEHTLLRMGLVVEAATSRRPPRVLVEPLLGTNPGAP